MKSLIRLISTDFDGTIHSDVEHPRVAMDLQQRLAALQSSGAVWVINTGRELASLTETLAQAQTSILPDFVVTVEREIHYRDGSQYLGLADWNAECSEAHEELFHRVRRDLPGLVTAIKARFEATIYEDAFSPFCLIATSRLDAEAIHQHLDEFARSHGDLAVVRNDVYIRFSHVAFNKGTALAEIGKRVGVPPSHTLAAGDHLNDLPMLCTRHAHFLVAPENAVEPVKEAVRRQNGFISTEAYGNGVARGLEFFLQAAVSVVDGDNQARHELP